MASVLLKRSSPQPPAAMAATGIMVAALKYIAVLERSAQQCKWQSSLQKKEHSPALSNNHLSNNPLSKKEHSPALSNNPLLKKEHSPALSNNPLITLLAPF
jgi:hypothetical protein